MKKLIYIYLLLLLGISSIKAQTIAAGYAFSLSVCTNNNVNTWGINDRNQLGVSFSVIPNSLSPINLSGLTNVKEVGAGGSFSVFLKNDGTVWGCGENTYGQLGIGNNSSSSVPIQVNGLTDIVSTSQGYLHSIFLKNDGTVWGCGNNSGGALGDGTNVNRYNPVQANGLSGIIATSAGWGHSIFLKKDGTVWGCGWGGYGQLGSFLTYTPNTPIQVNSITDVIKIAAGNFHTLFLKKDSTVWACGANNAGQLGDSSNINRSIPVKVRGLKGIVAISAGADHSIALKNDGTVWTWGYNSHGQLGDSSTISKNIPVRVSRLVGITDIEGGFYHTLTLKNDGTVWAFGDNSAGQLGDGTNIFRIVPVQTQNLCQVKQPTNYNLKGIYGEVYNDINQNCIKENESLLAGRKLEINPGNIIVETNESGYWYIDSLPAGNYTITADTSGKWRRTCPLTQSFTITNPDSFYVAPSLGFVNTQPCAEPQISVNMPLIRTGFSNQNIYLQACNEYKATGALTNGYIELELDPLIIPQSASQSYTSLGGNKYKFVLSNTTLNPGQCQNITVSCSLSTSAVLNSTLCIKANLYPADSCVFDTIPNTVTGVTPCTLPWDKSSLKVTGECTGDSIRFVVYNHGSGSMQCYAPVRIYVDGVLVTLDSIMLTSGDSAVYVFLGDGKTWRLEADQHPLHPGNSYPNATVENCNPGAWTPGLVNVLPQDDVDGVVDIYCGVVTGSYDPNDKTGYPLGINSTHDVMPNQQLEYVIRFQNTGTDTAFTVVIRDTLDTDLDIFSVVSGASSHKYKFRMYGKRVLEWTFNNILLPDSNVNKTKSHGFVTFTVEQNKNLTNGTEITNTVGIYFDFNAPVITNTTVHTVNEEVQSVVNSFKPVSLSLSKTKGLKVYPNPASSKLTVSSRQSNNVEIYNAIGVVVKNLILNPSPLEKDFSTVIDISYLPKGMYVVKAGNEALKLVVE